jgi:hypothetical protein
VNPENEFCGFVNYVKMKLIPPQNSGKQKKVKLVLIIQLPSNKKTSKLKMSMVDGVHSLVH